MKLLHWYICRTCRCTAVSATRPNDPQRKGTWRDRPICCVMCNSYMRFLYSVPVETLEDSMLYSRGLVYNPGTERERTV